MRLLDKMPDSNESDDEYWADGRWDQAVEEHIRLEEEQIILDSPPLRTEETSSSPHNNLGEVETPKYNNQAVPLERDSFLSTRLYPRIEMTDILTASMRTPPPRVTSARLQTRLAGDRSYSPGPLRDAKRHVADVPPDSDLDSDDDDFSSAVSQSPEGSPPRTPVDLTPVQRTNGPAIQSRLASPFSVLNGSQSALPDQSRGQQSTSHIGIENRVTTIVTAPTTPSSPSFQGRALNRAATAPALTSPSPSIATIARSKSMHDEPEIPKPSVARFTLGSNPDNIVFVAHDKTIQKKMDELKVSWGAQYEIARGLCNGWWAAEDVIRSGVIETFAGKPNRQSASQVASHILEGAQRSSLANEGDFALWAELDREQEAILENQGRGLGLMDAQWRGETNWYGGKIQQVVELVKLPQDQWKLKLLGMRKGRSHRFARYLGSRRILLLKLPKQLYSEMESLKSWLEQQFVLCGRKFVPFAVKDKKIYMCEVNEDVDRSPRNEEGDQYRTTLQDLVEWHNPLTLNSKQEVSKWTSRFDLGLSTSVPALEFLPENIFLIPDEYVQGYPRPNEKAPPHTIFTDGCGYMNGAALMAIGKHMLYSSRPTVVQGRFLGSKGVWMLHPEDRDPAAPPRIWVRDSQLKIHHIAGDNWTPENLRTLHRAHLIFDLLASPRMTFPARLNRLSILNLAHNGVPNDIFVRLMDEGLREEVNALRRWEGEHAMESLWTAVDIACGVTSSRLQRLAAGLQRALGLAGRETDDRASESELSDHSSVASEDMPAGFDLAPVTLGETVVEKLQAGFSPLRDLQLCEDLRQVIKNTLESYIKEYHICVPQSAEAFIIPDPYGVLQPGQIHFKSSHQPLKDPLQFLNPHTLTGDVLIYRNPARLPSDIQKVEAVEHPELAEYVDVIVLPIRGSQTLASLLAGGDVDGDTGVCVYDQSVVSAFHQPGLTPEPPGFLDKYFQSSGTILRVTRIIVDIESSSPGTASRALQKHLLQGLCDSPVGLYSMYHESCIYRLGYAHPDTIRIAHMFNYILDSRKTGLRVRPEVKRKDSTECSGTKPLCLGGDEEMPNNRIPIRRERSLGSFILDELMAAGAAIQSEILTEYQKQITQLSSLPADPDLTRPWKNASEVPILEEELSQVERLVDDCQEEWREYWSRLERFRNASKELQKAKDKAFVDGLAQTYATVPDGTTTLNFLGCLDRIKASYAYHKKPAFAWRFAHGELCRIKADSQKSRPFTKGFADVMAVPTAAARVFAQYNGAVLPQE